MVHQDTLDNVQKAQGVLARAKAKDLGKKKAKLQKLMKDFKRTLKEKSQHCTNQIKQKKMLC